jgi:hypothetical protein
MQAVVPCGANEPAAQSMQTGAASASQNQELSTALRTSVTGAPAAPATHEKRYIMAPSVGAAGVVNALAMEASGGCESASTSEAESARL